MISLNNDIIKIYNNPFVIFEIKNFLNDDNFHKIKNEFFDLDENLKKTFAGKRENTDLKYSINSFDPNYQNFIISNPVLKELHEKIVSQNFLDYLIRNLSFDIYRSKSYKLSHLFKILKIKKIKQERIKKFKFLDLFKVKKNINIQIEFSWMRSNTFLNPHTDAPNKLLSLMLYFPEVDNSIADNMGTIFWDYKKNNYENIYTDIATIKKKGKILHQNKFEGKTLFGFIKNSRSWHSVPELYLPKDKYRKSININLLF